ncbi:MAG TPA: VOC family protein [Candidatus Bathyarchaeia archaeon]|nr:VOC family protein [Candidatus Bathyarchaeia archaeon]
MFKKVDCVRLPVMGLDKAVAFYRDRLGHELVWRRKGDSAGLRMNGSDTEIVLVEGRIKSEANLLVESVDIAVHDFLEAGGSIVKPAFDIPIERCAVIEDPWGNQLVILDLSKGLLKTDSDRSVLQP